MMHVRATVMTMFLAAIGCCASLPAAADDDRHPADVTITVVEDPEQLKEKINKIQLPDVREAARPAQKAGKEGESDKKARAGNTQHNESAEHRPQPAGSPPKETAAKQPDVGRERPATDKPAGAAPPGKEGAEDARRREPNLRR